MRKLLIVDPWQGYEETLRVLIGRDFFIENCGDFSAVADVIMEKKPDYLILNCVCSEFEGFTVLRTVNSLGLYPSVIGIIQASNFYMELSMQDLNIAFYLTRPFNAQVAASRLTLLAGIPKERLIPMPTRRETIRSILISLGIDPESSGGISLTELIPMAADNPELTYTKHLYPGAGKYSGHTGTQVERNIRTAIEGGWSNQECYAWSKYFPSDAEGRVAKPSNSEFISTMVKILKKQKGQYRID